MSSANSLMQSIAERTLQRGRKRFGEDLCDIIGPVVKTGGNTGDSKENVTLATGIECLVVELAIASQQSVVGGKSFVSSHTVEMQRTPVTTAITPSHKLRVYRLDGSVPERIFDNPVSPSESFTPTMVFRASFVKQGYH